MKYARVFKDKRVLNEMLVLRLQGWPLRDLAFKFDCDHTNVRKACMRNGIPSEIKLLPKPTIIFQQVYTDWTGERLSRGKSYQEYLEEERIRKNRAFIERHQNRTSKQARPIIHITI